MRLPLLDPFRHHTWATLRLIEHCRDLEAAVLTQATAPGTYGTAMDTLRHVLGSEAGYRFRLTGTWPEWSWAPDGAATLDELEASVRESMEFWDGFLADGPEPDEVLSMVGRDGLRYTLPVGVLLTQVLDHGSEHRGQVCTVLTAAGVEPPVIDGWVYGKLTGRIAPATL